MADEGDVTGQPESPPVACQSGIAPPGGDPAGDFRWALARLVDRGTPFSLSEVARVARRSRTLIGYDGCDLPDVRREVLDGIASVDARRPARPRRDGGAPTVGRISDLEARLRRADSRNAVLVSRALEAERGRLTAERRLQRLRERTRGASPFLEDPCEPASSGKDRSGGFEADPGPRDDHGEEGSEG
ncbi:hypothetical protein [Sphingomonas sp.]|jgi:hypothetical protein|uniref:hypothetical protein n=1 Tax=Sphingomonas sp. TaxID=28214 RepID=UPI002DE667EF|nr:hypothetical protein [Sphingomonas sp.]